MQLAQAFLNDNVQAGGTSNLAINGVQQQQRDESVRWKLRGGQSGSQSTDGSFSNKDSNHTREKLQRPRVARQKRQTGLPRYATVHVRNDSYKSAQDIKSQEKALVSEAIKLAQDNQTNQKRQNDAKQQKAQNKAEKQVIEGTSAFRSVDRDKATRLYPASTSTGPGHYNVKYSAVQPNTHSREFKWTYAAGGRHLNTVQRIDSNSQGNDTYDDYNDDVDYKYVGASSSFATRPNPPIRRLRPASAHPALQTPPKTSSHNAPKIDQQRGGHATVSHIPEGPIRLHPREECVVGSMAFKAEGRDRRRRPQSAGAHLGAYDTHQSQQLARPRPQSAHFTHSTTRKALMSASCTTPHVGPGSYIQPKPTQAPRPRAGLMWNTHHVNHMTDFSSQAGRPGSARVDYRGGVEASDELSRFMQRMGVRQKRGGGRRQKEGGGFRDWQVANGMVKNTVQQQQQLQQQHGRNKVEDRLAEQIRIYSRHSNSPSWTISKVNRHKHAKSQRGATAVHAAAQKAEYKDHNMWGGAGYHMLGHVSRRPGWKLPKNWAEVHKKYSAGNGGGSF